MGRWLGGSRRPSVFLKGEYRCASLEKEAQEKIGLQAETQTQESTIPGSGKTEV